MAKTPVLAVCLTVWMGLGASLAAQAAGIAGTVRDETGGALPGVLVRVVDAADTRRETTTDARGAYTFASIAPGPARVSFALVNFAAAPREVTALQSGALRVDAVLHLVLNAEVTVTGKRTFSNIADAADPARDLVGTALSASQGARTAREIDARPIMRSGEVLETVPGVVISQHSGEGKANQYYLRGFNLDHGTDFATTVAGMPVNMPTHGHGHGYSELNFLIPELVSGVQFSKGPYFADQGDFATAGSANINYTNALDQAMVRIGGGDDGYGRALIAMSPRTGRGRALAALEVQHNDGPWSRPDDYRKVNGLLRYTQGDAVNGFSITAMGYRGKWHATDQIPDRAVRDGTIGRFETLDPTDGGNSARYSGSLEWQRTKGNAATKLTAYGIASDLDLFSNFTFFLDDPVNGDQFHQADRRFVSGAKLSHRRMGRWAGHPVQNTIGVQARNDDIQTVGLYRTQARSLLETVRQDSVLQTSAAAYAQNEIEWTPWLRTVTGLRADEYRFQVDASDPANRGKDLAGLVTPKAGAVVGPFKGTEIYVNAGDGFHSNDARGRVTPLARARGAEIGVRSVAVPHLQTTVSLWSLNFDSELVFVGDAGTTEMARPSRRHGLEWTNYFTPRPWLILDADMSWSRARFAGADPAGDRIPGAADRVLSAGLTVESAHRVFGSVRLRHFGPRSLVEDASVRSRATSLANLQVGYKLSSATRIAIDLFNVFDARDNDVDYYYASRLHGEPAEGVMDLHSHATLPRTARLNLVLGF